MFPLIYFWMVFAVVAFSLAIDFVLSRGTKSLFKRKSLRILASAFVVLMIIMLFTELYFFYPVLFISGSDKATLIAQSHVTYVFNTTVIPVILAIVALRLIDSASVRRSYSREYQK